MVFLWWCGGVFCGGVFCGGVFVVVWWCFCRGVAVFLWWCAGVFRGGVLVFFAVVWWCFCGGVAVFLWWRGGVFVVVFLWHTSCSHMWSHRVLTHRVLS